MAHVQTYSDTGDSQSVSTAQGSRVRWRLGFGLLATSAAGFLALFGLPVFAGFF